MQSVEALSPRKVQPYPSPGGGSGWGRVGSRVPWVEKWGWLDLDFLIRVGGNLARLAGIKVRFIFGKDVNYF